MLTENQLNQILTTIRPVEGMWGVPIYLYENNRFRLLRESRLPHPNVNIAVVIETITIPGPPGLRNGSRLSTEFRGMAQNTIFMGIAGFLLVSTFIAFPGVWIPGILLLMSGVGFATTTLQWTRRVRRYIEAEYSSERILSILLG